MHLKEIQQENQALSLEDRTGDVQATTQLPASDVQGQTSAKLDSLQKDIKLCLGEILALRQDLLLSDGSRARERQILDWLDFRQVSWRYEGIDRAYQKTYEWIFERSTSHPAWDNFLAHRHNDVEDPYLINGKAGSGKSTLLKFIYEHSKTEEALKQWAGTNELMILRFFSWNLGTALQKTHLGMLRGLLHAALEQYPELIPAVLPKLYRNLDSTGTEPEPEYVEIKQAFDLFIKKSRYLRLVIIIDGIDEFEGDYRDMFLFLRSLASHRVKLIISSRPLNACLESLSGCPTLRLQDLTRKDMRAFVDGELSTQHLMLRLVRHFPAIAPQLASDIVDKAEGVFLWVKLVVRLLVDGLANGYDLNELQARLTALPSGLRELYERMFRGMEVEYQKQAAVLFQLNERWLSLAYDKPLSGLVLWYAINSSLTLFDQSIVPMPDEVYDWNLSSLVRRVQSRCCGLLELRHTGKALDGSSAITTLGEFISFDEVGYVTVAYMHRTVHEFLTMDEVWQEVSSLTRDMEFSISTRLVSACLSTMKLAKHSRDCELD